MMNVFQIYVKWAKHDNLAMFLFISTKVLQLFTFIVALYLIISVGIDSFILFILILPIIWIISESIFVKYLAEKHRQTYGREIWDKLPKSDFDFNKEIVKELLHEIHENRSLDFINIDEYDHDNYNSEIIKEELIHVINSRYGNSVAIDEISPVGNVNWLTINICDGKGVKLCFGISRIGPFLLLYYIAGGLPYPISNNLHSEILDNILLDIGELTSNRGIYIIDSKKLFKPNNENVYPSSSDIDQTIFDLLFKGM